MRIRFLQMLWMELSRSAGGFEFDRAFAVFKKTNPLGWFSFFAHLRLFNEHSSRADGASTPINFTTTRH